MLIVGSYSFKMVSVSYIILHIANLTTILFGCMDNKFGFLANKKVCDNSSLHFFIQLWQF